VIKPTDGNTVVVPNVVGMPEEQARALLESYRLSTTYTNWQTEADIANKDIYKSVAVGCVLSQQPAAGTEVRPGVTVYLAARKN
jgi:beta-lactam-binding protein with PASTA domain